MINPTRIKAVARKEFIQIMRDPRSLSLAIIIPILLVFLFGYALNLDVDNVPIAIWNQDNSQISKDFILNFSNSRYFKVYGYYDNYRDLIDLMDHNKILIAMVIPKDFSHLIQSDGTVPVQFLVEGSDSNTAGIAKGYIVNIIKNYNAMLMQKSISKFGVMNPLSIKYTPRTWFNPNRESKDFVVPGIIAVIIMIIASLLTSLTVAKEWERGTMEQLIATPIKGSELVIGKFLPYFAIGFIDLLIAVIMGTLIFCVPLRGSVILLFGLSFLFLTGALMLGIFISITTKTQLVASQVAILATFMPAFLLSGFVYAIFNMPKAIQLMTYFIPATYYIVILRGIFLKGVGLVDLLPQSLFLLAFAALVSGLAISRFKKKVA